MHVQVPGLMSSFPCEVQAMFYILGGTGSFPDSKHSVSERIFAIRQFCIQICELYNGAKTKLLSHIILQFGITSA